MFSILFWKDVFERSVATFLEFALVLVPANFVVIDIDWKYIATFCVVGFLVSFAKCLLTALKTGTPSIGDVAIGRGRHSA